MKEYNRQYNLACELVNKHRTTRDDIGKNLIDSVNAEEFWKRLNDYRNADKIFRDSYSFTQELEQVMTKHGNGWFEEEQDEKNKT